ncbi:pectate lyase family protein [Sphingobacterium pedocola]|uniref:Pectate lyase n=1 Tax=Sphingobacterium pedocola TaxID=2082722 RepID=A0ABR9T496_9SPHI|nr:hypothetical protein [Sphingobacterium pedocola]MBE8719482.1 hypothetical protein [Sphingobacterium pedocola]
MTPTNYFFIPIVLSLFIFQFVYSQENIAFPGAEGFGRFAKGARGVDQPQVYFVTNLSDEGKGSLRDAVSQPGRFVIFKVSGIIKLESKLKVAPFTTIAGQTAPGDGVTIYGRTLSFTGSNNTIARYLRVRLGINGGASKNEDASGISNGKNIILDHMSITWGLDEVFSISWDKKGEEPSDITLQNSIIGQGLHAYNHSAGGLIQSGGKISILKSLYHSNKTRNPKVKGINEFVNNVVYNFGNKNTINPEHSISADAYILGGESAAISNVLILNNYFIGGPSTPQTKVTPFSRGNQNFNLFQKGNYYDNNQNGKLDGVMIEANNFWYPGIPNQNFKNAQYFATYPSVTSNMSALSAFDYIVDNVGAVFPKRDAIDDSMIEELKSKGLSGRNVHNETDFFNMDLTQVDGKQTHVEKDTDNDGIPDEWEEKLNLNKNDRSDALQFSSHSDWKGYLNIEVYLNAIVK